MDVEIQNMSIKEIQKKYNISKDKAYELRSVYIQYPNEHDYKSQSGNDAYDKGKIYTLKEEITPTPKEEEYFKRVWCQKVIKKDKT